MTPQTTMSEDGAMPPLIQMLVHASTCMWPERRRESTRLLQTVIKGGAMPPLLLLLDTRRTCRGAYVSWCLRPGTSCPAPLVP